MTKEQVELDRRTVPLSGIGQGDGSPVRNLAILLVIFCVMECANNKLVH